MNKDDLRWISERLSAVAPETRGAPIVLRGPKGAAEPSAAGGWRFEVIRGPDQLITEIIATRTDS